MYLAKYLLCYVKHSYRNISIPIGYRTIITCKSRIVRSSLATVYLIDCLLSRHFHLSIGYSTSYWLPAHQTFPSLHWLQYIWLIACSSDISTSLLATVHLIDYQLIRHFHLSIGYSSSDWLPAHQTFHLSTGYRISDWLPAHQTFPSLRWLQFIWLITCSSGMSIFPLATVYLIDCLLIRHFYLSTGYNTFITYSSHIPISALITEHLITYN